MELPAVSKQELDVAKDLMLEFCDKQNKGNLLGSYPYLINCLYSYSWKILTADEVEFLDGSGVYKYPMPKRHDAKNDYKQCELINTYLVYKSINVSHSKLSALIAIRNKLVHEPRYINTLYKMTLEDFPDTETMEKISKLYFNSDICVKYINAIIKFCKDSKKNKKKDKEEKPKLDGILPDINKNNLHRTDEDTNLMEQLMKQGNGGR